MLSNPTPAELKHSRLETAQMQLDAIEIAVRMYRKAPTEVMELTLKTMMKNYQEYKKLYNL